jgi:hypothetical protein
MKCNETLSKWCKNKHGASKIMDMLETYQHLARVVHFHLKTHFTPIHKMRQDLSEKAFNQTDLTVPPNLFHLPPSVSTHG